MQGLPPEPLAEVHHHGPLRAAGELGQALEGVGGGDPQDLGLGARGPQGLPDVGDLVEHPGLRGVGSGGNGVVEKNHGPHRGGSSPSRRQAASATAQIMDG
ncbi:MAG: hypothetical protein Kow0054_20040 [Deferrisoma sp.]